MQHFVGMLDRKGTWMFESLNVGNFILSIQASHSHYCTPRETLPSAGMYSEFEVAIFENNNWINPLYDERFSSLHDDLQGRWETGSSAVGAYIPIDTVQEIYELIFGLQDIESTEQQSEAEAEK